MLLKYGLCAHISTLRNAIARFLTLCARVAYTKKFEISRTTGWWAVRTARDMDYREVA